MSGHVYLTKQEAMEWKEFREANINRYKFFSPKKLPFKKERISYYLLNELSRSKDIKYSNEIVASLDHLTYAQAFWLFLNYFPSNKNVSAVNDLLAWRKVLEKLGADKKKLELITEEIIYHDPNGWMNGDYKTQP